MKEIAFNASKDVNNSRSGTISVQLGASVRIDTEGTQADADRVGRLRHVLERAVAQRMSATPAQDPAQTEQAAPNDIS